MTEDRRNEENVFRGMSLEDSWRLRSLSASLGEQSAGRQAFLLALEVPPIASLPIGTGESSIIILKKLQECNLKSKCGH